MKDAAQDVVEDVTQDAAQDLAFEARAVRALLATPPPPSLMGAQLGSSVAFGSGCGQTLRVKSSQDLSPKMTRKPNTKNRAPITCTYVPLRSTGTLGAPCRKQLAGRELMGVGS